MSKYVDADDFKDFKNNFNTMVSVFNHSVTSIREDSKKTSENVQKISNEFNNMKSDIIIIRENTKNNNWKLTWIFGIIATIVVGGVLGTIMN